MGVAVFSAFKKKKKKCSACIKVSLFTHCKKKKKYCRSTHPIIVSTTQDVCVPDRTVDPSPPPKGGRFSERFKHG